jgi:phosphopantothenoylcysteine decarboxylase/phosphopantothenate--cysteine ligase
VQKDSVIVKTAAVSDFRPTSNSDHKVKKEDAATTIELTRNPDILRDLGKGDVGRFRIGFAAETRDLDKCAAKKIEDKKLHMIVGNLVNQDRAGFAGDDNTVTLYFRDGQKESLPTMGKDELADIILDHAARLLDA